MTLYFNSFGKNGYMSEVTYKTCVMPQDLRVFKSEAAFMLPKYSLGIISFIAVIYYYLLICINKY